MERLRVVRIFRGALNVSEWLGSKLKASSLRNSSLGRAFVDAMLFRLIFSRLIHHTRVYLEDALISLGQGP